MSINKCILVGNVGKDPEIRSMGNSKEVASFGLATTDTWKDKNSGEKMQKTEWHNIVIFTPGLINLCKNYIKKGSKLYIEGALQTRKWTSNDGIDRSRTEIVLQGFNSTLQMLDSKSDKSSRVEKLVEERRPNAIDDTPSGSFASTEIDDDIPF